MLKDAFKASTAFPLTRLTYDLEIAKFFYLQFFFRLCGNFLGALCDIVSLETVIFFHFLIGKSEVFFRHLK